MDKDIFDPEHVAAIFDRCATNYRRWSVVASFGFVARWRRQCIAQIPRSSEPLVIADLMAGTGELWPYVLRRFPNCTSITAVDISEQMHKHALDVLHQTRADRICHLKANILDDVLPEGFADVVVASFGLKTFNKHQQEILAQKLARILKEGGRFSFIEASDPKLPIFATIYRLYLKKVLPLIEKLFLNGAQDFSNLNIYVDQFEDCSHFLQACQNAGLDAKMKSHFFRCATSVSGMKPRS